MRLGGPRLEGDAARGGVARGVVKRDLCGCGTGGAGEWDFNGECFIATVTDAVGRLFDGFMGAVVEDDFNAIEQRERIAAVDREFNTHGRPSCCGLKYGRRGVIDHELICFEGETQAVGARARCGFGGDQPAEIDAVREPGRVSKTM